MGILSRVHLPPALIELKPYDKPIYITENGIADASDELRQQFIPRTLARVRKAISGSRCSRVFLLVTSRQSRTRAQGFWLRFGLVAVDRTTQARAVRPGIHLRQDRGDEYS